MLKRIIVIIGLSLLFFVSYSFAEWEKKPEFRWGQTYYYDIKHSNHQLYINRVTAAFNYQDKKGLSLFKIMTFFEVRRNIDRAIWEREELGMEIGKDLFPWFYLGESIQAVWLKEDYLKYTHKKERDSTESETRLLAMRDLFSNKHIELKGFILDEYTYDFAIGSGTCNEFVLGLILPVNKNIETQISWRHIDRIHDFDSNVISASLTLVF